MSTQTKNKVKFVHFSGYESDWNQRIFADDSAWNNTIVFGKVWDSENKCNMKIYAGKDSIDSSVFIYDIASLQLLIDIENKVENLQELLAIDSSHFTNPTMKYALENFIANDSATITNIQDYLYSLDASVSEHIDKIDSSIQEICDSIDWKIVKDE